LKGEVTPVLAFEAWPLGQKCGIAIHIRLTDTSLRIVRLFIDVAVLIFFALPRCIITSI
jgi:hypothetical protein